MNALTSGRHGPDHQDFYGWTGPRPLVEVGGRVFEMPAFFHRSSCFSSVHLASHDAVSAALPSEELRPLRWFDGRAAVQVSALRYDEITGLVDGETVRLAPYAEIVISALVTRRSAPPGVGLLAAEQVGGVFALDLPVTTAEARDLGCEIYGLPKFVADMDFVDAPGEQRVTLSDGDATILGLAVRPRGRATRVRRWWRMYSSRGGRLLETAARMQAFRRGRTGRGGALLTLGDHPVAQRLRDLHVQPESLASADHLGLRMVLPAGVPVGAARAHAGHHGSDRDRGRYTVDYAGTGPLDQYAPATGLLHVG